MLQLTIEEANNLRSQIATLSTDSHFRHKPRVFTEHGILMLSSVLRSPHAVQVNIEIMRAFVKMRPVTAIHGELNSRLTELEKTVKTQGGSIDFILDLIDREMKKKRIGFKSCPFGFQALLGCQFLALGEFFKLFVDLRLLFFFEIDFGQTVLVKDSDGRGIFNSLLNVVNVDVITKHSLRVLVGRFNRDARVLGSERRAKISRLLYRDF